MTFSDLLAVRRKRRRFADLLQQIRLNAFAYQCPKQWEKAKRVMRILEAKIAQSEQWEQSFFEE